MFMTCSNKGFHITFPNGVTLSTQFGAGNYGSNYHEASFDAAMKRDYTEAITVEVAAFNKNGGKWRTKEAVLSIGEEEPADDVLGYVGIDNWLKFFDAVRALPPTK